MSSRPVSTLTVPSTQNTAPVLDFRCLYTFDLRRKAKRWQDGLARFHTFNKRIMVYDEPRNFIGDTHWRETETIQEGDELQLDKGVLIQIGEPTGKMNQDISAIVERKKTKQGMGSGSSPARVEVTQHRPEDIARPTDAVPSQLRPRTLNSLLGTPKGRIGRAALPTKSPFEERSANERDTENIEPAAKRRRITTEVENRPIMPSDSSSKASLPHPAPVRPRDTRPSRPVERQPAGSLSHDNPRPRKADNAAESVTRERNTHRPSKTTKANSRGKDLQTDSAPPSLRESAKRPQQPPKPPESASKGSSEVVIIDSGDQPKVSKDSAPQGGLLRIEASKPRKKLMYKALLPSAQGSTRSPRNAKRTTEYARSHRKKTSRANDPPSRDEALSQFHKEQRERLRRRLTKSNHQRSHSPHHLEPPAVDNPESLSSEDDFGAILPDYAEPSRTISVPGQNSRNRQKPPRQNPPLSLNQSPHNTHVPISPANIELARLDAQLLRRHPPKPFPSPTDHRPTPLSESMQRSEQEPSQPPILPPKTKSFSNPSYPPQPPAPAPNPNPPQPPPPKPKHPPLQRSLSAVITSTTPHNKRLFRKTISDPGPPRNLDQREAAPDAWSAEAWELFGRRREDYGVVTG